MQTNPPVSYDLSVADPISPSRGLLRDCTTGCGTDGALHSTVWCPLVPWWPGHGSAQFDGHPTLTFRSAGLVTAAPSTLEVLRCCQAYMPWRHIQIQLQLQARRNEVFI